MPWYIYVLIGLLVVAGLIGILVVWLRPPNVQAARDLFLRQRQDLETQFFTAAASSGKPRGLRWKAIEWDLPIEWAREPQTGKIAALVGITIQFEAVEGSDMEGLPAVGNLRNASAVFFFDHQRWHTVGRTLFNMNPDEAIQHFKYERLTI
jgi:hypothetical protein